MKPKLQENLTVHNSASLTEAERRIQALEEENLKLKSDLADISSVYNILVKDGEKGNIDERRVNMLKSQVIQLERQLLMLNDSLGCRAQMLQEVEIGLLDIADITRGHLREERGAATVPRQSLQKLTDIAESCRIKLAKNMEICDPGKHQRALLMMDKFLKKPASREISLYDVCSGSVESFNLKHVAKLESTLAQVFHHLTTINHSIRINLGTDMESPEVTCVGEVRLSCQLTKACELLNQATSDLMELSLLIPSAPWPPLQKPFLKDITKENVLSSLPNFVKSKSAEGERKIEALVKAYNFMITMKNLEISAATKEIEHHEAVQKCQRDYMTGLMESMKTAYMEFEKNTDDVICKPLKEILNKYQLLKQTASETDLREFLTSFKVNEPLITNAVDQLQRNKTENSGIDALSLFGAQFFTTIDKLRAECDIARNQELMELEQVKKDNEEFEVELQRLFPSKNNSEETEYEKLIQETESLQITTDSALNESGRDTVAASARSRRRAAKLATSGVSSLPSQTAPAARTPAEPAVDSTSCDCGGSEPDTSWEASLRAFTPDLNPLLSEPQQSLLSKNRQQLGPIRNAKPVPFGSDAQGEPTRKVTLSRLPKGTGANKPRNATQFSKRDTPKSGEMIKTPNFGTPASKLSLKPRGSGSDQDLSRHSEGSFMKRSSSLSSRPDWVT